MEEKCRVTCAVRIWNCWPHSVRFREVLRGDVAKKTARDQAAKNGYFEGASKVRLLVWFRAMATWRHAARTLSLSHTHTLSLSPPSPSRCLSLSLVYESLAIYLSSLIFSNLSFVFLNTTHAQHTRTTHTHHITQDRGRADSFRGGGPYFKGEAKMSAKLKAGSKPLRQKNGPIHPTARPMTQWGKDGKMKSRLYNTWPSIVALFNQRQRDMIDIFHMVNAAQDVRALVLVSLHDYTRFSVLSSSCLFLFFLFFYPSSLVSSLCSSLFGSHSFSSLFSPLASIRIRTYNSHRLIRTSLR